MSRTYMIPLTTDYHGMPFDAGNEVKSKDDVMFALKVNKFTTFVIDKLLLSNKGTNLNSIYAEYRQKSNSSLSNSELEKLAEDFYSSVKNTGMFLLRKEHVPYFPKTSFMHLFKIKSF